MFRICNRALAALCRRLREELTLRRVGLIVLGAMIASFGIHNIHQQTGITEGGVMGLMLLIEHWLGVSPALITPVLDFTCYLLAFTDLGGRFIRISVVSTLRVSLFYKIWEMFPPMLPDLSAYPLAAAVLGALFVGVGVDRPAGRLERRRRRPGADHLKGHPLASGALLSLHRPGGAGAVPQLHPVHAHRLLTHHRHPVLLADRPGAELHPAPRGPRPPLNRARKNTRNQEGAERVFSFCIQSSIVSVPPTMRSKPHPERAVSCSRKTSQENATVTRILSLSIGTTTLAKPSCKAR